MQTIAQQTQSHYSLPAPGGYGLSQDEEKYSAQMSSKQMESFWDEMMARVQSVTGRSPHGQGLLAGSALLSWRRHWGPRDSARGHRGIISWRIRAVVPRRYGYWRHLEVGLRTNP